ncbi:hypothetical protein CsatB_020321 [Cannabis sativa]|uniref:uncharacterized protein LOC133030578 n=1 Tax=Cannabis sativa TaxID=3483 RepID=UPI0029CA65D7|nr:uncharacterized protein LOC133030578 [Cannabis sativa]
MVTRGCLLRSLLKTDLLQTRILLPNSCKTLLQFHHNCPFGIVQNSVTFLKIIKITQDKVATLNNSKDTSPAHFDMLKSSEPILDELLAQEEECWKQCSQVSWLKSGDSNTKFFHQKANSRHSYNTIKSLIDDQGNEHSSLEGISRTIEEYFNNIYATDGIDSEALHHVISSVPCKITADMNQILTQPYTTEDVYTALNSMSEDNSPDLDGMSVMFYTNYWHIVGDLVTKTVLNILNNGVDPSSLTRL